MYNQKDNLYLFIGKAAAVASAAGTQVTKYSDLDDGEVVLVNNDSKVLISGDGTYDPDSFDNCRLVQRSGTNLLYSPRIKKANITNYKGKAYAADTQQVVYLGSNGTSGAMDTATGTLYQIRFLIKTSMTMFGNKQMWKDANYKSLSTTSQGAIALGLAQSFEYNMFREPEKFIKCDVINSAAGTANGAAADTVIGYKGSDQLVFTDTNSDSSLTALTVGDFVRIGTATTAGVYKIIAGSVAVTGGTVTLDRPLNTDVSLLGTTSEYITAAQAAAADFGLKFTGLTRTFTTPGWFPYYIHRFEVLPGEGFVTAVVNTITTAAEGTGTYHQINELEYWTNGAQGKIERLGVPAPILKKDATEGKTYDMLILEFYNDEAKSSIVAETKSKIQVMVAFESDAANGSALDVLVEALDDYTGITSGVAV